MTRRDADVLNDLAHLHAMEVLVAEHDFSLPIAYKVLRVQGLRGMTAPTRLSRVRAYLSEGITDPGQVLAWLRVDLSPTQAATASAHGWRPDDYFWFRLDHTMDGREFTDGRVLGDAAAWATSGLNRTAASMFLLAGFSLDEALAHADEFEADRGRFVEDLQALAALRAQP